MEFHGIRQADSEFLWKKEGPRIAKTLERKTKTEDIPYHIAKF